MSKRLGILTSGGDCAGLNAAIRAVVYRAIRGYGWQVFGIHDGSQGLMSRPIDYEEFDLKLFTGNILRMGGTLLGTVNKGDPFAFPMPDGTTQDSSRGLGDVYKRQEVPYTLAGVAEKIRQVASEGRNHALVVVAEGVKTETGERATQAHFGGEIRYGGIGQYLGAQIDSLVGAETRVTVLGHVQRGGMPSMRDRLVASAFGVHAVDLVAQGRFDRMVAWQDRGIVDVPLRDVIDVYRCVDPYGPMVMTARGLGIYVGESS